MKLFAAVLRCEWMLQWRSLRFRVAVLLYLVVCLSPVASLFALRHQADIALGPATFLAQLMAVQPLLSAVLGMAVAGHRSSFEALREIWPVLSAAAIGNAGYLLRRWLAILVILVPVTAMPLLGAAAPVKTPLIGVPRS